MNLARLCSLLGVLALAGMMPAHAQQADVGKTILGYENQWLQAELTSNPDTVAPLFADEYIATNSSGKFDDKAKTLADIKSRKYTSGVYENVSVAVFGNTVIARGGFKGAGTDASGKPFTEHLQWTDTWVKMPNGEWQIVATQYTAI
jgi:ketosteroid isomerase-like protein